MENEKEMLASGASELFKAGVGRVLRERLLKKKERGTRFSPPPDPSARAGSLGTHGEPGFDLQVPRACKQGDGPCP